MAVTVFEFNGSIEQEPKFNYTEQDKQAARITIQKKIYNGRMLPAHFHYCVKCGKQARDYHHHNGYDPFHWDDVIPVCHSCHMKIESELREKYEKSNGIYITKEERKEKEKAKEQKRKARIVSECPKTIEEAIDFCYNSFRPHDRTARHDEYIRDRCAYPVHGCLQCERKNGNGLNGLFCMQHAKIMQESA